MYYKFIITSAVLCQALSLSHEGWNDFPGRVIPDPNQELKQNIFKLCTHIRQLDNQLTEMLTNYSIGDIAQLLYKMNIYNEKAQKLLDYLKSHKLATLCIAEDILDKQGPDFMDVDIDEDKLKTNMNCTDNDLKQINELEIVTTKVWSGLFFICNNIVGHLSTFASNILILFQEFRSFLVMKIIQSRIHCQVQT